MNRLNTAFAAAIVAALWVCGCGGQKEPPAAPRKPGTAAAGAAASKPATKPRIALVMKSLANEFFKTMEEGARAHQAASAGRYDLIVNGLRNEEDVAGQIAIVEQMIAQKVDAVVIAPTDSKAMVPVCKKVQDAGIVVVNIDNRFDQAALADKGLKIPFAGPNNRTGARLAGEHLARNLQPGDKVAIVEGVPNAFNAIQRKLGFEDAMNAAGMKIITSQTANWETDQAEKIVSGMITQHPDLKAILCANDSMALGAVAALRAVGKAGGVLVVGYDNIGAIQKYMKEGKVLCTIDQHADQIGVGGIECALDILVKKAAPADRDTPVDLKTAADVK